MARIPALQDFPAAGVVVPKGAHLQQLVEGVRALADVEGYTQSQAGQLLLNKWVLAKIVTAGPNGEANLTGALYWIQLLGITGGDWDKPLIFENDATLEFNQIVPATNLAEWVANSHNLPVNRPVWARAKLDRGDPVNIHWAFDATSATGIVCRVNLTMTSGSNGSKTAEPSWVYNCFLLGSGAQVGSSLSPETDRRNGSFTVATKGEGYFDATGAFVLIRAFEKPGTGGC